MTNTPAPAARRSLIVSTPATRRAYDAGRKAHLSYLHEDVALELWERRNGHAEWFDGDAVDAWQAGYSDADAAPVVTITATPAEVTALYELIQRVMDTSPAAASLLMMPSAGSGLLARAMTAEVGRA